MKIAPEGSHALGGFWPAKGSDEPEPEGDDPRHLVDETGGPWTSAEECAPGVARDLGRQSGEIVEGKEPVAGLVSGRVDPGPGELPAGLAPGGGRLACGEDLGRDADPSRGVVAEVDEGRSFSEAGDEALASRERCGADHGVEVRDGRAV